MMTAIVPETLDVVMERLTRRAEAAVGGWSAAELRAPSIDQPAIAAAMQRYLAARGEPMKPLRWFTDGTSARGYIRSRVAREPKPAYWPSLGIARALDIAWFAGAVRPPIEIAINRIIATRDWENWVCGVSNLNAAKARDPGLTLPANLKPLDDGFPPPPDAGRPITAAWLDAVRRNIPPLSRAVHPERLWTPLFDAFAGGLYFF